MHGFLARRYGASTVRVADFIHRNREYGCVNCVCHWPGCPYLMHTLGSVAQKSCRIMCENAGKYRLDATRAPDYMYPAIREWLGTPSAGGRDKNVTAVQGQGQTCAERRWGRHES